MMLEFLFEDGNSLWGMDTETLVVLGAMGSAQDSVGDELTFPIEHLLPMLQCNNPDCDVPDCGMQLEQVMEAVSYLAHEEYCVLDDDNEVKLTDVGYRRSILSRYFGCVQHIMDTEAEAQVQEFRDSTGAVTLRVGPKEVLEKIQKEEEALVESEGALKH